MSSTYIKPEGRHCVNFKPEPDPKKPPRLTTLGLSVPRDGRLVRHKIFLASNRTHQKVADPHAAIAVVYSVIGRLMRASAGRLHRSTPNKAQRERTGLQTAAEMQPS